MRTSVLRLLLLLTAVSFPIYGVGQAETSSPVSFGGFLTLGLQSHQTPVQPSSVISSAYGIYGESTRLNFHPGLDVRFAGDSTIHGVLVGPRVSASWRVFHPYAEVLFGPNNGAYVPPLKILNGVEVNGPTQNRQGVTKQVVFGLDADLTPSIRWRVLEFSQGFYSAIPGSQPRALSVGVVIHFP